MKKKNTKEQPSHNDHSFLLKIAFFIFVFVLVIYGATLKNGYSMDDEYVVYKNELVQKGIKGIPEIFTTRYSTADEKEYGYRPIVKATYAIEYQLFGEKPGISHFINLLIYAATGFLLFVILRRSMISYHWSFPLLITVLFLAHPLHTEVVSSLKNRDELLSFLFALMALFFAFCYAENKSIKQLLFICSLMFVSMLCKPSALTFIALVPLSLFYFTKAKVRELIIVSVTLIVGLALAWLFTRAMVGAGGGGREHLFFENPLYADGSFLLRTKATVVSLYFYVKMLFVPHPLVAYYGYNQVSFDDWMDPLVIAVCVITLAAGFYALYRIRKKEVWTFGVLFTLIALSMYLNLVIPAVGVVAERFAYVASLGFCIVLAWAIWKYAGAALDRSILKQLNFKWIAPALILVLFGIKVMGRVPDWKDHYTLLSTDVKYAPRSAKLHGMLATQCAFKGRMDEAKRHYEATLEIYPGYITSLNNLALINYSYLKDTLAAIDLWKRSIQLDPEYADGYYNLAAAEDAMDKHDEAEKHYNDAIRINPGFNKVYERLGLMYARLGRYEKVLSMSNDALKKGVVADILHLNIGNVMMLKGDTVAAVASFEKGVAINPRNPALCGFLSRWFSSKDDAQKAGYYSDMARRK